MTIQFLKSIFKDKTTTSRVDIPSASEIRGLQNIIPEESRWDGMIKQIVAQIKYDAENSYKNSGTSYGGETDEEFSYICNKFKKKGYRVVADKRHRYATIWWK